MPNIEGNAGRGQSSGSFSMIGGLRAILRRHAMRTGKARGLFVRLCRPSGFEYAAFLRRHGGFAHIGDRCSILPSTTFTDPAYVSIGDNVHFATATIVGHDGSVGMMEAAYGVRIDAVGAVQILDNVFIGHQAIIMPGVTIGPDAIVAAGAVVTGNVEPDSIVAGIPARRIGSVSDLLRRRLAEAETLPWIDILRQRGEEFDPAIERALVSARVAHFYPK